MTALTRLCFLVTLFAFAIAGCSDDDDPGGGGTVDTTAPAVTSVTAIDIRHIDVAFDEEVQRASAEDEGNYVIVEQPPILQASAAPGDTLIVTLAALKPDGRTVSLSTFAMDAVPYEIGVTGVADVHGNVMSSSQDQPFSGTTDPDVTPPEIVSRTPGPNATDVGTGQSVIVRFLEPVLLDTADWTLSGGTVPYGYFVNGFEFVFHSYAPLAMGTTYTMTIGARDFSDNAMADATWSFTTTNTIDVTPPRVTSSTPTNGTGNVSVDANLSLTFSETIDPYQFDVLVSPAPPDWTATWSNSGKTVTFDPDWALWDDLQYAISVLPGGVRDLAGNGNTEVFTAVFSTGQAIGSGSFTGTVTGDPTSSFAGDPTNAVVIATYPFPFGDDNFGVFGNDVVESNGSYDIRNLHDGLFYTIAVLNSNGDNEIDPEKGDAVGAYGADLALGDIEADSVVIDGGNRATNVNFQLFDPSAISGTVAYNGIYADEFHQLFIGVFDTTAFDPQLPPDYGTTASWPVDLEWAVDELGEGLLDGVYFVGAFLDANNSSQLDAGDPLGLYGGFATPIPIRIENGRDGVGVVITLEDTKVATSFTAVTWPRPANRAPWLKAWSAAIRQHASSRAEAAGSEGK
jgi:Bacterial Ig-like domain